MSLASIFLKLGAKGIGKIAKTAGKEILKKGSKEVLKKGGKEALEQVAKKGGKEVLKQVGKEALEHAPEVMSAAAKSAQKTKNVGGTVSDVLGGVLGTVAGVFGGPAVGLAVDAAVSGIGHGISNKAAKDKEKKLGDAEKLWFEMQDAEKAGDLDKYNRLRQIYDRMPKNIKKENEKNIVSRDEMQEALGMTPRDAIIRAGTRTLSNGVSAAGKIAHNNSYRLAQALLSGLGNRVPASKREAFGAGIFDAPVNVAANKILKKGEDTQIVTDAVSNNLNQNLDDYISQQNLLNSMMYAQNFDDSRGAYDVFARTISNSKRPSNSGIVSKSERPINGITTGPVKNDHTMNI